MHVTNRQCGSRTTQGMTHRTGACNRARGAGRGAQDEGRGSLGKGAPGRLLGGASALSAGMGKDSPFVLVPTTPVFAWPGALRPARLAPRAPTMQPTGNIDLAGPVSGGLGRRIRRSRAGGTRRASCLILCAVSCVASSHYRALSQLMLLQGVRGPECQRA
jgi:hypothetical protein